MSRVQTSNGQPAVYNSSTLTLSDMQAAALQLDVNGNLKVAGSGAADNATYTVGTTTGNVVQGVFQTTPDIVTNNKTHAFEIDSTANLKVTEATLLAGENLTTNRLNNEPIYSYARMTTAATLLVKSGAGTLHSITINTPVASGVIEFDDALTNTTPIIGKITLPATLLSSGPQTALYDISFATGLSITTTNTMDLTIAYR